MADDKDKRTDATAKKKLADKYETAEDLEKAYMELQKTLGTQGGELGTLRKQSEEAQQALMAYAQAMQQYKPVYDWFAANQANLQQYGQWLQARQTGAAQGPANQAINQGALALLTAEEQQQLVNRAVQEFQRSVFDPWRQTFDKQLTQLADQRSQTIKGETDERLKAYTEVLWRTFQHAFDKPTVDKLRNWHERSLRYVDKSFDPMVAAKEELDLQAALDELKTKNAELQKSIEAKDRELMPSLGRTESTVDWAAKREDAPKGRDERFQRVMTDTLEKSGREAVRDLFPGASR